MLSHPKEAAVQINFMTENDGEDNSVLAVVRAIIAR